MHWSNVEEQQPHITAPLIVVSGFLSTVAGYFSAASVTRFSWQLTDLHKLKWIVEVKQYEEGCTLDTSVGWWVQGMGSETDNGLAETKWNKKMSDNYVRFMFTERGNKPKEKGTKEFRNIFFPVNVLWKRGEICIRNVFVVHKDKYLAVTHSSFQHFLTLCV